LNEKKTRRKSGVASLERALTVLEAFREGSESLTLTELGEITGLHKSTILRLATSLLRRGYLQRLEDGHFRLGPAVFHLGRIYQRSIHLADAVMPVLRSLVAKTNESASFWIPDADGEICLHRVNSPHPVREAGIDEGDRFRSDGSGGARIMLAFLGAVGEEYEALRQQVTLVVPKSKRVPGGSAIVAPVFGLEQKLVGTLVLSGPEFRFSEDRISEMKQLATEHAATLTRMLGGDPTIFQIVLQASPVWEPPIRREKSCEIGTDL